MAGVQRIPPAADAPASLREMMGEAGARTTSVRTLANHPELGAAVLTFHKQVAALFSLGLRLRELVVLRIAWSRQTQYAWAQHVRIGQQAGLGEADIEAIKAGGEGPGWSQLERLAVRAAGELCGTNRVSDETWTGLEGQLDRRQLMELMYLIGQYELNCWMFNALRVEIEPEHWSPDLPPA